MRHPLQAIKLATCIAVISLAVNWQVWIYWGHHLKTPCLPWDERLEVHSFLIWIVSLLLSSQAGTSSISMASLPVINPISWLMVPSRMPSTSSSSSLTKVPYPTRQPFLGVFHELLKVHFFVGHNRSFQMHYLDEVSAMLKTSNYHHHPVITSLPTVWLTLHCAYLRLCDCSSLL